MLDVNQLNELLHLSETKAPEAVNLDRFFRTGFMFGFAWKDLIWTMQGGNGFEISPHANSLQFHMNIQSLNTQENESLEKAINLFALHMMCEQANPAVIFSNWDKLDQYTKTIIIYSARKKCYMLMAYTEVFVYLCLFDFIFSLLEISSVFLILMVVMAMILHRVLI